MFLGKRIPDSEDPLYALSAHTTRIAIGSYAFSQVDMPRETEALDEDILSYATDSVLHASILNDRVKGAPLISCTTASENRTG